MVRRIAGECLANSCMSCPGIGNDDLKTPGLGARVLNDDTRCSAVKCLTDMAVAVITGPCLRDGNEQLAGVQPAMIVAAAGDFPVRTSHESSIGEQLPQTHRGNASLRQAVNEPARHRRSPPCQALSRLRSRWMPRLIGRGILGQSPKKGNARVDSLIG